MTTKNDIALLGTNNEIVVKQGTFELKNSSLIKERVLQLLDFTTKIEVTEEGLKEAKKLAAGISKEIKALDRFRIDAKKKYLEPYDKSAAELEEIKKIASQAENNIRVQTRALEQKERDQKETHLKKIFEKRKKHYNYATFFKFEDYLEQKYLNKTTSIEQAERAMVEWFEKRKQDIEVLESTVENDVVFASQLELYFDECGLDLGKTIMTYKNKTTAKEEIKKEIKKPQKHKTKTTINSYVYLKIEEELLPKVQILIDVADYEYEVFKSVSDIK